MSLLSIFICVYLAIGFFLAIAELLLIRNMEEEELKEELGDNYEFYKSLDKTLLFLAVCLLWPVGLGS